MARDEKSIVVVLLVLCCWSCTRSLQGECKTVHYYDFVIAETNLTRLCETKSIMTVNGSYPGPTIRVRRGDTVFVNVHNHGAYGITLHWHGVKQPGNPWSDGPEYITQCPVQAGMNFTYEIVFTDEEGTLWWHAHSDWDRATIHGAIVILAAQGASYPYPQVDGEEVLVLASWYKRDLRQMVWQAMYTGEDTPRSDAYTINGQPGDLCDCSNETTYRLTVDHGKTYLLRIINAANNAELFFAIADHNLTVVSADASYTKPFTTPYIMISPGQTVDLLLTANQSPDKSYYMAAHQYSSPHLDVVYYNHANATAILQYSSSSSSAAAIPVYPSSTLPAYKDYAAATKYTSQLRSLTIDHQQHPVPVNLTARMMYVISMGMVPCDENRTCDGYDGNKRSSSVNNVSFVNPKTDILGAYYYNLSSGVYKTGFPDYPPLQYNYTDDNIPTYLASNTQQVEVKVLEFGDQVEIVFQGTNIFDTAESHPMHLHGHSFYVVATGSGNFEYNPHKFNLVDPPRLNTVSVPHNGWSVIRFTAKNPGVWFMHCHYDRHMSWGMAMAFIVKDGNTANTKMRPPPNYMPPCNRTTTPSIQYYVNYIHHPPQL